MILKNEKSLFGKKLKTPQSFINDIYERSKNILETAEDLVLGFIADARYKSSNGKDYIDIEALLK